MTSRRWFRRRLVHLCTVQQDTGTARSAGGRIVSSWADQYGSQPCRFIETDERLASPMVGEVLVHRTLVLMNATADVDAAKRLRSIRNVAGTTIAAGTYVVNRVLARQGIDGEVTHLALEVERVAVS